MNHLITVTLIATDEPTTDQSAVITSYDVTVNGVTNNVAAASTPNAPAPTTQFTVPDGTYTLNIQNNNAAGPVSAPVTGTVNAPAPAQLDSYPATGFTYTSVPAP